jgi:hypothetical protein
MVNRIFLPTAEKAMDTGELLNEEVWACYQDNEMKDKRHSV